MIKLLCSVVVTWMVALHGAAQAAATSDASVSRGRVFDSALELRAKRKMAIGFSVLGPMGLAGITAELNFAPDWSALGGFGGGPGYQTYNLQVKHVFGGTMFAPYAAAGYAQWYTATSQQPLAQTRPGFLATRFLSDEQRRGGSFQENILFPSLGMQYMQLDGDFAGTSLFVELVALWDLNAMAVVPTATTGFLYYF